jgi:hypothetical protein
MAHSASKVQLGTTLSNHKTVTSETGTIEAGLVVCQDDDGTIDVTSASGSTIGVSLGNDSSNTGKMAICRKGLGVPVQVGSGTPAIGAQVAVSNTTGKTVDYTGSGDRYVNAVYKSVKLTNGGIKEDGTTLCDVAIIDFVGGL